MTDTKTVWEKYNTVTLDNCDEFIAAIKQEYGANELEAQVMLYDGFNTKEEAIDHINSLVTLRRQMFEWYAFVYRMILDGEFPGVPADSDATVIHEAAKDEAIYLAHHHVFRLEERDIYELLSAEECEAVVNGYAIDKLLKADHDAWMNPSII